MKRRVYVMDCGEFVKIGVSGNVEVRKGQIPYKVEQYYSTRPLENAFIVEREAHHYFSNLRAKGIVGREYFLVSFDVACDYVRKLTDKKFLEKIYAERKREKEEQDEVKEIQMFERHIDNLDLLSRAERNYVFGIAEGLAIVKNNQGMELQNE